MAEQDVIAKPKASGGTVIPTAAAQRPVLENGDRLTRCEFERRYLLRSDVKKAELIEGVVYMPSPVRFAGHGEPHAAMLGVLLHYGAFTPGVRVGDNATVRLDLDNEPQPDILLRIEPAAGGRSRVSDEDYIDGAPELVVEVAASSAAIDLHDKLNAYRRNGVPEYVVWRTEEGRIDWFVLADGEYRPVPPDDEGVIHSRIFPGLRVAAGALLSGDLARALAELEKGIASPEHDRFVARLARHA
ncbi:MAG: Uma2 family endonuclease [Spirochaetaceae bacterium]|nr:Uma2 family endonuclease [Spirochaetaceae bacterium]